MHWLKKWFSGRRTATDFEAGMSKELEFHVGQATEDYIADGLSPEEAARRARREFGAVDLAKEELRDTRRMAWFSNLGRDVRYALRRLVRDRVFSLAAIAILALGIGANTAIFSLINAALFRPLPFSNPDRVVNVYQNAGEAALPAAASWAAYQDIAAQTDVFSGVAAILPYSVEYNGRNGVRPAIAEFVTSNYLSVLGSSPTAGRWFDPSEDRPRTEPAAVLGHAFWSAQFGADPDILGQTVLIMGVPVTVVGIAPESYQSTFGSGIVTSFWLSISSLSALDSDQLGPLLESRQGLAFLLKARLQDGISPTSAQAAMDVLGARLAEGFPGEDPGLGISVLTEDQVHLHPQVDALVAPVATILLVVVGLVLAVACSNLATLLLVRGTSRAKEVSVRLALGATRGQLVRHLLTESVLLAMAGAGAGFLLAGWGIRWLQTLDLPISIDLSLDARVLACTVLLSLVTGIAFGLMPALRSTRLDLVSTLRDQEGTVSLGRRWFNLKNGLLVFQVAASCLLLGGTAMGLQTIAKTQSIDPRFAVEGVAFLSMNPEYAGYTPERASAVSSSLLEEVRAIPGVVSAAAANEPPGNITYGNALVIDGYDPPPEAAPFSTWLAVGPGYFETLEIPLLFGRPFDLRDGPGAPQAVVVNQTMAQRYFGGVNAVGLRFALRSEPATPIEIIGVVPDTLTRGLNEKPAPLFYRSIEQVAIPSVTVLARTSLDADVLVGSMQDVLRRLDPALSPTQAATMERHLKDSLGSITMIVTSLGALGLLGLTLACIGLYAVVAYAVSHRHVEVGIRMALGARPRQVVWLIGRDVVALIVTGIAVGVGLSWAATRLLEGTGSVAPAVNIDAVDAPVADPVTMLGVVFLIAAVGMLAAFIPARRATHIDPAQTLRAD